MDLLTTVLLVGTGIVSGMIASMVGGAAIVVYPVLIACGISPQIAAVCNLTALTPATMLAALSDRSQLPPFNRAFAGLINLERLSDQADAFHRIYRGQHPTRRDRVILHLYDLSASADKQAFDLARREFETLQRWQKSPFVPSLLDSFQDVDGYPGELYFFSLVPTFRPPSTRIRI